MKPKSETNIRRLDNKALIGAILERSTDNPEGKRIIREVSAAITEKGKAIDYNDLSGIRGIGHANAVKIMAVFEIGRRFYNTDSPTLKVSKPEDILPLCTSFRDKKQEHFVVITLNGAGEIIENRTVSIGLLNHTLVHPREVFADAITDRAASIICVHNHPSGSLEPSCQDIAITTQLKEAGTLLGIQLVDHLIVTKNSWLSRRERGMI